VAGVLGGLVAAGLAVAMPGCVDEDVEVVNDPFVGASHRFVMPLVGGGYQGTQELPVRPLFFPGDSFSNASDEAGDARGDEHRVGNDMMCPTPPMVGAGLDVTPVARRSSIRRQSRRHRTHCRSALKSVDASVGSG
jgi:hypothetical protein